MALINRITRLFRADLHSVLDRIEEPETLLKQAVREMAADVSNDERHQVLLEHQHTTQNRRASDLTHAMTRFDDELDVCFESGELDLARSLVRRKLQTQVCQGELDTKNQALGAALVAVKQRLEENRSRLSATEQKLELLADVAVGGRTSGPEECRADRCRDNSRVTTISDDEVEIAFLGEQRLRASP